TGKSSHLLHAGSSMVLNAIKILANIPDEIDLLSPLIIKSVGQLKKELSGLPNPSLDLDEALITLSISATTNSSAKVAMAQLKNLSFCEVHLTNIPSEGDEKGFRKLQTNTTWDTK
ncbi:MAG: DUF1846 family protein, partial [Patescibacteria group bacterium]|nr:DUF1846 family protein [Patescibacteria group bacterium]